MPAGKFCADECMRPFGIVIHGFAQVVQQAASFSHFHVCAQF